MAEPVIDTSTGEMLCDGHCGGKCDPQTCDCAEKNECETEITADISEDIDEATYNERRRQNINWGTSYHSAHEGFSWIRQAMENTSRNDKNMSDGLKSIWANVKCGDTYSVAIMANDLARQAKENAELYIKLAVACEKTVDSVATLG